MTASMAHVTQSHVTQYNKPGVEWQPYLLVACCGFDLERNAADAATALAAADSPLAGLRAVTSGRAFVLDGNRYFARPSPALAVGGCTS
jgi:hypothetical protein